MNEFNIPPPMHFRNPLQEALQQMKGLQEELVGALGDVYAEQSAMRSLLGSLIATHPEPKRLAEAYLHHMDATADSIGAEQIERYREVSQRWRDVLLELANQQSERKP